VSQAHCRLAKAWQAKGNIAVGLAIVQSQLQQDPAHQALNTLQVRNPLWVASLTSASVIILAAACHSKSEHGFGGCEELATV